MFRIMMMTFSLIAAILVDIAANIVPFNGITTGEIANRLPVLFMPSGYVYAIWAVIYILLIVWLYGFWQDTKNSNHSLQNGRAALFISSSLLNIAWILFWHYGVFYWTIVIATALLFTLLAMYFTYPQRNTQLFGRLAIGVYLGWIFILTITNISYVLTFHEWSGWGLSDPLWTVIYLTIATAIALHFLYHHADIALNVVFMWTFVGIAVRNGADELFVSVAALFLTAAIGASIVITQKAQMSIQRRQVSNSHQDSKSF